MAFEALSPGEAQENRRSREQLTRLRLAFQFGGCVRERLGQRSAVRFEPMLNAVAHSDLLQKRKRHHNLMIYNTVELVLK